jgi:hypothetical protein
MRLLSILLCWLLLAAQAVAAQADYAQQCASLSDPAKLATLGKRGRPIAASSARAISRFPALDRLGGIKWANRPSNL